MTTPPNSMMAPTDLSAPTPNPTALLSHLPVATSTIDPSIHAGDSIRRPASSAQHAKHTTSCSQLNKPMSANPLKSQANLADAVTDTPTSEDKCAAQPCPNPSPVASAAGSSRSSQTGDAAAAPSKLSTGDPSPPDQSKRSAKKLGADDVVLPNPLPRPVGDDVEDDEVMRQYREQGMTADLIARKKLKMGAPKHLWIAEEDVVLASGVAQLGEKCWSEIATLLPGRVGKQCRDRWRNHLCPMVKKGSWTDHEDKLLFYHHQKLGNMWAEIAKHIPGRTDLSVKNRFYSFLRKIGRQMARAAKERHAFNQQAVFRYLRSPQSEPGLAEVSPQCWAVGHPHGRFSAALFAAKQAAADKAAGTASSATTAAGAAVAAGAADSTSDTDANTASTTAAAAGDTTTVPSTGMVAGIALPMEEVTPELAYAYDYVLGGIAKEPPEPLPTFTAPVNASMDIIERGGLHTPLGKAAAKAAVDAGQLAAKVKEKKRKAANASYAAAARKKRSLAAAAAAAAAGGTKRNGHHAGALGMKAKGTTSAAAKSKGKGTKRATTAKSKKGKKVKGLTVETGAGGAAAGGQGALGMLTSLLAAGTEDAALVTAIAGLTEMATPNSKAAQRKRTASAAALAVAAAAGGLSDKTNKKKRAKRSVSQVAAMARTKRARAASDAAASAVAAVAALVTEQNADNNKGKPQPSAADKGQGQGGIQQAVDSAADLLLGLAQPSLSPSSSPSPMDSPLAAPVKLETTATTSSSPSRTDTVSDSQGPGSSSSTKDDASTVATKPKFADVRVVVPSSDSFVPGNDLTKGSSSDGSAQSGADGTNEGRVVGTGKHVLDVNTLFSPSGNVGANGHGGSNSLVRGVGGGAGGRSDGGASLTKATPKNVEGSSNSAAAGEISKRVFASPLAANGGGSRVAAGGGGGGTKADEVVANAVTSSVDHAVASG